MDRRSVGYSRVAEVSGHGIWWVGGQLFEEVSGLINVAKYEGSG